MGGSHTDTSADAHLGSVENWNTAELLSRYGTVFALLLLHDLFSVLPENVLTVNNPFNVIRQISMLMIVALGQTNAVDSGEFDLSVGQVASLGGMLVAQGASLSAGPPIGLANGLHVASVRIPFLIPPSEWVRSLSG